MTIFQRSGVKATELAAGKGGRSFCVRSVDMSSISTLSKPPGVFGKNDFLVLPPALAKVLLSGEKVRAATALL